MIDQLIASAGLTESYIGFHIRGGDKFNEDELYPVEQYFDQAVSRSACRNAFILTDDYRIIQGIQQKYPDWTIGTLCTDEEHGYYHQEFLKKDKDYIKRMTIRLFASIEILKRSEMVIGTFSSNPGMFLGMAMEEGKCFDVAGRDWQIW